MYFHYCEHEKKVGVINNQYNGDIYATLLLMACFRKQ